MMTLPASFHTEAVFIEEMFVQFVVPRVAVDLKWFQLMQVPLIYCLSAAMQVLYARSC